MKFLKATLLFVLGLILSSPAYSMDESLSEVTFSNLIMSLACFDQNADNLSLCRASEFKNLDEGKVKHRYDQIFTAKIKLPDSDELFIERYNGALKLKPLPLGTHLSAFSSMEYFLSDYDGDVINVLGVLSRRKPEKSDKYELVNALFSSYCDLSALPSEMVPNRVMKINPKRINKLIKKNKQPTLKDGFKSLKSKYPLSDQIGVSVVIKNAANLRKDFSNLQSICRLTKYDDSFGDWYSVYQSIDVKARIEPIKQWLGPIMLAIEQEVLDKRSNRIREISKEIDTLREIKGKHHDLFLSVLSGDSGIGEFKQVATFPRVLPTKPDQGKWEPDEDYQARLKQIQLTSPVTLVYTLERETEYNYESQSFEISPYLCDLEETTLVSSKSSFLYEGTNAFNAKRNVKRLQRESLIHRPKFDQKQQATFRKTIGGSATGITIPFDHDMLSTIESPRAMCLHRFYPDSSLSYAESFPYTHETFSDPIRREETNRYIYAYPFAWALVDTDKKAVIASFDLVNPNTSSKKLTELLKLQSSLVD